MNKHEIMQKLRELGLPEEEYWLVAGGAMVLHGIKNETHDIDLGCSRRLADRLDAMGFPSERMQDGKRRFAIGSEIEIFGPRSRLETLSQTAQTIPYELLCAVSRRVPRVYKNF